jgi:hypothetical protein
MMWLGLLACTFLAGCGGGQAGLAITQDAQGTALRSAALDTLSIPESEITQLSDWQQTLLADGGWNQPYIQPGPSAVSALPAPSRELLLEMQRQQGEQAGNPDHPAYRGTSATGAIPLGAYKAQDVDANGVPDFGCNADPALVQGCEIEDVIAGYALGNLSDFLRPNNVKLFVANINHFNSKEKHPFYPRCVYQTLARDDDPETNGYEQLAELCYIVPAGFAVAPGEGQGPGGPEDCGMQAYSVRDAYWMSWNQEFFALPSGQTVRTFNILPGPVAETSPGLLNSITGTTAGLQPFHFGSWDEQYSVAGIIGIESANSGCEVFDEAANLSWQDRTLDGEPYPNALHNAILNILQERWQQSALPGVEDWHSHLGWPIAAAFAFNNGALNLDANGSYYAFGQFFERGFIWWLDYDQQQYPEARDRTILYRFDGNNTFCEGDYRQSIPDLEYNASGAALDARLLIDMQQDGNGDWQQIEMDLPRRMLHSPWIDAGGGQRSATIRALVQPSGGVTLAGEDIGQPGWGRGLYRSCTWLWHDGTITPAGTDYDPAQFESVHTYLVGGSDIESIYTVRAQVVDADGNISYTDSLPLQIGSSSAGAAPALSLIRNDQGRFPAGYEALVSDLGELGLPFTSRIWQPGMEDELQAEGCELAIWYQGGPGAEDELFVPMADWTSQEIASLRSLLSDNISVLLLSQNLGMAVPDEPGNAWLEHFRYRSLTTGLADPALAQAWGRLPQGKLGTYFGNQLWLPAAPQNLKLDSFAPLEVVCGPAERGYGSTADKAVPKIFMVDSIYPFSGLGHAAGWPGTAPQFVPGSFVLPGDVFGEYSGTIPPQGLISWGSTAAPHSLNGSIPDLEIGNGNANFWVFGASWPTLGIWHASTLEYLPRSLMLGNLLGWLRPDSRYFSPLQPIAYDAEPEIVSVTPYLLEGNGLITAGSTARTSLDYPDPAGSDVLRSSPGQPDDNYLQVDTGLHPTGEDGLNANDLDLQFPFYAYITWDDNLGLQTGVLEQAEITDISYGGLLLKDDADWQRADPLAPGYVNPLQFTQRAVAGYYLSLSGDSGDELRAGYGSGAPQLSTNQRGPRMLFEAIAHWPVDASYGGQAPYLRWSMFPGHKVAMQTTLDSGHEVEGFAGELPLPWQYFVRGHDIDPDLDSTELGRNKDNYLVSDFSVSSPSGGRSMLFDYASVRGLQADLNGNELLDSADKFPVRVRLITDYADFGAYSGLDWPNAFPGSNTFVEGGCYIAFRDDACELIVMDDPELPDPAAALVIDEDFTYDIPLSFIIDGCLGPYDVNLDWNYTGQFGESGHILSVGTLPASGAWTEVVSVDFTPAGGAGIYFLAIQVVDSSIPAKANVYAWPEPVVIQ